MIECYSKNVTVSGNEALTWNNTNIKKGSTVDVNGASIQFNKCGIYEVTVGATVSANATKAGATSVTLQLFKNGIAQPQATATGSQVAFTTLVQVKENNSCCACTSPTNCNVINMGEEATLETTNLIVTKLV